MAQDKDKTAIADLLRMKEASDASGVFNREKLAEESRIQDDQNRLKETELRNTDLYRRGMLNLNQQEINQKIKELESLDAYREGSLTNEGKKIQQQISELKSLDAYRGRTLSLRDREVQNQTKQIEESILHNKNLEILKGRETAVAERRVASEEKYKEALTKASEASKSNNVALSNKYQAEANRLNKVNKIIDEFLAGDNKSELSESIAKHALGLPVESESQKRLRANDLTNAELEIIENGGDDEKVFNVHNKKFLADAPDSMDRFYIYDTEWKNEALQVPLAKGKTLGDVRKIAAKKGITLEQALQKIYEASK